MQRLVVLPASSRAPSVVGPPPVLHEPTELRSWPRRAVDGVKEALRRRRLVREVRAVSVLLQAIPSRPSCSRHRLHNGATAVHQSVHLGVVRGLYPWK